MDVSDLITVDPEILGGAPVFRGTRVPIKTLFDYLEDDYSLEEFLECFPSVGLSASDLGSLLGERSLGSKILTGDRVLSKTHIRILAKHFRVRADLFL